MGTMSTNVYSHLTAKERDSLSYPARYLLNSGKIKGNILDFGCGFGKDVEYLLKKGYEISGYDKYYFQDYPRSKYDTILCFYVLNVLLPLEQAEVLMEVSELLKPEGIAYFAVRRDIQYEGFRIHKLHQKPTYQCLVKLNFKSIFKNENCEIYEYRHFNQLESHSDKLVDCSCPFCQPSINSELITESATAYAIYDKYPVSLGHALIIPKKHAISYFELTYHEQSALWFMTNHVQQLLSNRFQPDGFNIGINIGRVAGQTIDHVHVHVIPRYTNDSADPEGGVRGVIPEKRKYN